MLGASSRLPAIRLKSRGVLRVMIQFLWQSDRSLPSLGNSREDGRPISHDVDHGQASWPQHRMPVEMVEHADCSRHLAKSKLAAIRVWPLLGFTLKHPAAEPDSISGRPWFCVIWKPLHTMQGPKFHVLDRIPAQGLRKGRHRKMSRSLAIVSASQARRLPMTEMAAQWLAVSPRLKPRLAMTFTAVVLWRALLRRRCCSRTPERASSHPGSRPEHGGRALLRVRPGGGSRQCPAERPVVVAGTEVR